MSENSKIIFKSLWYSFLSSLIFFGFWILYFLGSSVYIQRIIINSIFYTIPLFIIILLCSFFIIKARDNQEKFPILKIVISIFTILLITGVIIGSRCSGGSAESTGFCFISLLALIVCSLIASIILISLIGYFYGRSEKLLIILLVVILISVSLVITFKFTINKGCLPADYICFAEIAIKTNNPNFCEKTSFSTNCFNYYNYEIIKKGNADISICEENEGELRDECMTQFARTTKNPEYCKSVKISFQRLNCCLWVYEGNLIPNQGGYNALTGEQKSSCGLPLTE